MKKISFILNIGVYSQNSGWARVMHKLAKILYESGENVYTLGVGPNGFKYNLLTLKNGSILPDFYPNYKLNQFVPQYIGDNVNKEIDLNYAVEISDNGVWATDAKFKIIWFVSSRDDELKDADFVFVIDDHLKNAKRNFDGQLFVADLGIDFWKPGNFTRTFNTYYLKKYANKNPYEYVKIKLNKHLKNIPKNKYLVNFDKTAGYLYEEPDHIYNREILQNTKYFLSLDSHTFMSLAAAMCGCISIVVPDNVSYEDWSSSRMFKYGISYGFENIDHAISTQHKVHNYLEELEKQSHKEIKNFINFCYEKF